MFCVRDQLMTRIGKSSFSPMEYVMRLMGLAMLTDVLACGPSV